MQYGKFYACQTKGCEIAAFTSFDGRCYLCARKGSSISVAEFGRMYQRFQWAERL